MAKEKYAGTYIIIHSNKFAYINKHSKGSNNSLLFIVGIDLGTTYTYVSIWQNDEVKIIPNDYGFRATPSYVAFTEEEILVGDAAKAQITLNPYNTVFDTHRLIGRDFYNTDVQSGMKVCFSKKFGSIKESIIKLYVYTFFFYINIIILVLAI
jgi:molecular chaperone DnaK (HSP70)